MPVLVNGENLHGRILLGFLLPHEENIYRMLDQKLDIAGDDVTNKKIF